MLIVEFGLRCDDCGELLDLRVSRIFTAREMAKERGWRMKLIDHRQMDFCPGCLAKRGIKTNKLDWLGRISCYNPDLTIPTLEKVKEG